MNMMFIEFIKREDMPMRKLRANIRRQNRTLVKAIQPDFQVLCQLPRAG
jgi:hypothetical protein